MVKANGLSDRIQVIPAKIEEIDLPEQVDTIISEPIGYMLFNERMIETYLHAKKFLKPGGRLFYPKHVQRWTLILVFCHRSLIIVFTTLYITLSIKLCNAVIDPYP